MNVHKGSAPDVSAIERSRRIAFDGAVALNYDDGRRMTVAEVEVWTARLANLLAFCSLQRKRYILDLGAGTGRFAPVLAERCSASVIGVEPAASMRAIAVDRNPHRHVTYLGGTAEHIPLVDRTCDAGFLFLSLHHFADRRRAASEISRVCKRGSPVIIRTEFADRPHMVYWHTLLPDAGAIDRSLYPTFEEVVGDLLAGGLTVVAVDRVPYLAAESLRSYIDRLRYLSISALRVYGADATEAALAQLRFDECELNQPVYEVGHLIVCEV